MRFLEFDNDAVLDLYEKLHAKYGAVSENQYEIIARDIGEMLSKNTRAVEMIQYEILTRIMRLRRSGEDWNVLAALEEIVFLPQTMVGVISTYLKETAEGQGSVPGQA